MSICQSENGRNVEHWQDFFPTNSDATFQLLCCWFFVFAKKKSSQVISQFV